MASIPACHAGDRGSIPRDGDLIKRYRFDSGIVHYTTNCNSIYFLFHPCEICCTVFFYEKTKTRTCPMSIAGKQYPQHNAEWQQPYLQQEHNPDFHDPTSF